MEEGDGGDGGDGGATAEAGDAFTAASAECEAKSKLQTSEEFFVDGVTGKRVSIPRGCGACSSRREESVVVQSHLFIAAHKSQQGSTEV